MADTKEKEIREQQEKTLNAISNKDSVKRKFNWGLVGAASATLMTVVGVGISALGGKIDIKITKNNK